MRIRKQIKSIRKSRLESKLDGRRKKTNIQGNLYTLLSLSGPIGRKLICSCSDLIQAELTLLSSRCPTPSSLPCALLFPPILRFSAGINMCRSADSSQFVYRIEPPFFRLQTRLLRSRGVYAIYF
ncbi:unnamed protein product [Periconia digitata]|uniref:Uncharacterized protein n=1 Tax=Periconia digitata TaxID=1303443 RepID=A0A9W4UKD6_9PLEO|nr:unnamed protein product [Periconia digitata]